MQHDLKSYRVVYECGIKAGRTMPRDEWPITLSSSKIFLYTYEHVYLYIYEHTYFYIFEHIYTYMNI